jgi:aminoglycoside phosphotransferase (APT) family kinase protein
VDQLLASGLTADVFAIDETRVLRRYRQPWVDVAIEVATMAYVAGYGFPVPRVYEATGADMVLERLDGPTMLEALLARAIAIPEAARILADLHTQLHALPARVPGGDPTATVLHLDLHPANVILTGRGPVVIDWTNAIDGPADFDLALTAFIIAEAAVDPAVLAGTVVTPEDVQTLIVTFIDRAGGDLLRQLDRAHAYRRDDAALGPPNPAKLAAAEALVRASTR